MKLFYSILFHSILFYSEHALTQHLFIPSGVNGIGTSSNLNIGIGTNNPIQKLDVRGSIYMPVNNSIFFGSTLSMGNRLRVSHNTNNNFIEFSPNLIFKSGAVGAQDRIVFTNDGKVGIGTMNPSYQLAVEGTISTKSFIMDNSADIDYVNAFYIKVNRDLTKAFVICDKNANEVFRVYGNGIMYSKKIFSESIEVRPDAKSIHWYDNVLKENYKLPNYFEIKNFIKNNGHLKDVPSEIEVKECGIELFEMNAILLKKIEELTLYILDLNERLEKLEQK